MRLGNLNGTVETIVNPVFSLLDKNRMQLSPKAMDLLQVGDKDRVDIMVVDNVFYIAKEDNKTLGRAISKTGLFQHPATHSFMAKAANNDRAIFTIDPENTMATDGLLWYGLTLNATEKVEEEQVDSEHSTTGTPSAETVSESSADVSENDESGEVGDQANEGDVQPQVEEGNYEATAVEDASAPGVEVDDF
jgi:hypothetical protein